MSETGPAGAGCDWWLRDDDVEVHAVGIAVDDFEDEEEAEEEWELGNVDM